MKTLEQLTAERAILDIAIKRETMIEWYGKQAHIAGEYARTNSAQFKQFKPQQEEYLRKVRILVSNRTDKLSLADACKIADIKLATK